MPGGAGAPPLVTSRTVPCSLGIDLGTTNAKAALVGDDGAVVSTGSRPITTSRSGDAAEQDPEGLWSAVVGAVREATAAAPDAAAAVTDLGVCSQYSSIIPVGADGRPTAGCVLYLDQRGTRHSWAIVERHPEAFEVWMERHGIPPVGGGLSLGHILHLQHDRPEVHADTTAYLEPMDFVNLRLTGRAVANQCTVFMSQLCDNRELGVTAYDADLIRMSGVDPSKLPPLVGLDEPVGELLPDVAEELGLGARVIVRGAMNDSHAGALATGAHVPGRGGLMIGTTSVLLDTVDRMALDADHEVLSMPSPIPGRYVVWAENGISGRAVEHVLERVVYAADELGDHITDDHFRALDAVIRSVEPGSGRTLFLPWLSGSLSPDVNTAMRGAFLNLSLDTTRPQLVRAMIEGTSFNLGWLLPFVESFTGTRMEEVVFGGGAARSEGWSQILADVLDRPVLRLASPETAVARTVALCAARGVAEVVAGADSHVELADRFTSEPGSRSLYEGMQEQFVASFEALAPIYEALNG